MSEFSVFLQLGLEHIADLQGYDHILFIIALCAIYKPSEWKRLLILVTAFTIGHSVTLALATLEIIPVDAALIEFLIPVTIVATAVSNLWVKSDKKRSKAGFRYVLALFFGLIHGMGFSNYLRSLLGKDESIIMQLFAFNVGLEVGQLLIVLVLMVIAFIFMMIFRTKLREWNLVLSGASGGIALIMALERYSGAF